MPLAYVDDQVRAGINTGPAGELFYVLMERFTWCDLANAIGLPNWEPGGNFGRENASRQLIEGAARSNPLTRRRCRRHSSSGGKIAHLTLFLLTGRNSIEAANHSRTARSMRYPNIFQALWRKRRCLAWFLHHDG